ncbi:MAG: ABC transporter permease [Armatimonadota bacterium]|nr:ABC transporter permease [bacterium]
MISTYEDVVAPPKRFVSIDWGELWRYRDLFLVLAWRDIAVRYKQTALGVAWSILQPLITMVIFTFIFNRMAGIKSGDNTPYPIFLYVGQLFWLYFSGTLSDASNSMVQNAQMIQKIYFPRLIVPATAATTRLIDLAVAALILIGMMIYYGFAPKLIGVIIIPLLLLSSIMSALGIGLFLAAINVKYRDVRYALPFFIQTIMYITPVIYPITMLNKHHVVKILMLWLNPMSGVITNARAGIIGNSPIDWYAMGTSLISSFVYLMFGLYYFRNTERFFADIV